MKKSLLALISIIAIVFSASALANKIVITGQPTLLQKQGDVYVPSQTITTTSDHYYFNIDNTNRVCYLKSQPTLTNVSSGIYNVTIAGRTQSLHCYTADPTYFDITP